MLTKIIKVFSTSEGRAIGMTIPKSFCDEMEIKAGSKLKVEYKPQEDLIILRKGIQ